MVMQPVYSLLESVYIALRENLFEKIAYFLQKLQIKLD